MRDAALFRAIYHSLHRTSWLPLWQGLSHLGASQFVLPLAGLLLLDSALARARARSSQHHHHVLLWLGIPAAALVCHVLKQLVHRPRPFAVYPELGLPPYNNFAFPSGHATLAFALAAALSVRWPNGRIGWYALAVCVAVSRVALGAHWPTDVLAGAVLGWGVVQIVARIEDAAHRRATKASSAA